MIIYDSNFLNDEEISILLSFWDEKLASKSKKIALDFYGISLKERNYDLTKIKNNIFNPVKFTLIRLQKYDESINQLKRFHSHNDIHNYVVFLNDDFEGGELIFEDGLTVKPKKGSIVYICNNERHKVENCIGTRLVLVACGNHRIDINNFSTRIRKSIL